ncbi:MAG TPA: radical SAM protein [bacterium]|nr:radical SAM protein [bacterium]
MGGWHSTIFAESILASYNDFDYLIIGEGEKTFAELIEGLNNNQNFDLIKGLAYKKDNKIVITEKRDLITNIDEIPRIERETINQDLFFDYRSGRIATIITTRGCPYDCSFCASQKMWQRRVRFHSAEYVLEELDYLKNKWKVKKIIINDDTFSLNFDRFCKITEHIKKLNIKYWCNINICNITDDLIKQLKISGCELAMAGIESGSNKVLKYFNKNITKEQIIEKFEVIKKYKLKVGGYFILNSPIEDEKDIEDTIDLIKQIKPFYVDFSFFQPFPGSKLAEQLYKNPYYINWSEKVINYPKDESVLKKYEKVLSLYKFKKEAKLFFLIRKILYKLSTKNNKKNMFINFIKNLRAYLK